MRSVITIDGPSGVGKGTLAKRLARALGFVCLDSGAFYRLAALEVMRCGLQTAEAKRQAAVVAKMKIAVSRDGKSEMKALWQGREGNAALRNETTAQMASQLAAKAEVRAALVSLQRCFGGDRGLVADGRDMGTVVFPDADLKIFLEAKEKVRAQRRYKQLKGKGENVNLSAIEKEIAARDARDRNRKAAPLEPASDAVIIETSDLSIDQVMEKVKNLLSSRFFNFYT